MAERNTLARSMRDLGPGAWFGGSLVGAVLNGAAQGRDDGTAGARRRGTGRKVVSRPDFT